jgi:putative phosphoribosyl transferase
MIFADRAEAGRHLARHLRKYADRDDVIVLGVPRGGVPVAFEIATRLRVPLDVLVLRKLGVPGQEELAFGAIAGGGVRILDPDTIRENGLTASEIDSVIHREEQELQRREREYRAGLTPLRLAHLTVILVDDGIATGSSMRAAIRALRQMKPARLVLAVPVAGSLTTARLRSAVDEVICLESREPFYGVGQFYEDFSQVSDAQVTHLLHRASQQQIAQPYSTLPA